MEQNILKQNMWNSAGTAGLALGAVSTAYMFITQYLGTAEIPAMLSSALTLVFWGLKFVGCIWLMAFFMKRFAIQNPEADDKSIFRMGCLTAMLSALVFAGVTLANVTIISADLFNEQYQTLLQQMAPALDSNSMNSIDKVIDKMPYITFFSNLIYCSVFGTVLSSILSRRIWNTQRTFQ
jgi:hypothetical protein